MTMAGIKAAASMATDATEEGAYEGCQADLRNLKQSWAVAKNDLVGLVIAAIGCYKIQCSDLSARRAQKLQDISSVFPLASEALQGSYVIPDADNGIFLVGNTIFSYRPEREKSCDNQPRQAVVTTEPTSTPCDHICNEIDRASAFGTPVQPAEETNRTLPLSYPKHESPALKRHLPTGKLHSQSPGLRPICETRSRSILPALKTLQPPIKTSQVARGNYWIFEYRTRQTTGLYILRCPSETCTQPVFTKNPCRQDRARRHMQGCNQKFKDEADIIRRYGRLVVADRKGRDVKRSWARKINSKLLASDEGHLEAENLSE